MQIDKLYTAIWHDTTTAPGTPLTGLSATITIRDKSDNSIVVNNQAMVEVGLGEYDYTFTDMDSTKAYSYVMNPNSLLAYVETGFVDPRLAYIDKSVSEIAVGWNPYITGISGIQGGIQRIMDKVEAKGEDIKTTITSEVSSIVIPEQKEPIVNVTTEKIDTSEFIKAIKDIKPEVNVTTEVVNNDPILTAIQKIGKLSDIKLPEYREPKEVNLGPLQEAINDIKKDIIKKIDEKKNLYEAVGALFEQTVNKNDEENIKKPFPSEFTAKLN